jgi:hypothetical protein
VSQDSVEDYASGPCTYCGTCSGVHLDGCPNQFGSNARKRRSLLDDEENDEEEEE